MKGGKLIGFNPQKIAENMKAYAIEEQSRRLVVYALDHVEMLGNTISSWNSRHHMDDTGNLLDSLCWGVLYNGKYVGNGFYRQQKASVSSSLHAWWGLNERTSGGQFFDRRPRKEKDREWKSVDYTDLPEIWGHNLAQQYLDKQERSGEKGWKVFFAILAPYWGYWEKGFTLRHLSGSSSFIQFAVMTQFYDGAKAALSPAKVSIKFPREMNYSNSGLIRQARREIYRRDREGARIARLLNKRRK